MNKKGENMKNKGHAYECEKRYLRTLEKIGKITAEEYERRIHNYRLKNGLI